MTLPRPATAHLAPWFALALAIAPGGRAQQAPLTGQMLAPATQPPAATPASAPTASPPPPVYDSEATSDGVGDITRRLLAMQAAGTQAGKALPIPGAEASASYARYLKSFEHPIPVFFESTVPGNANGMSGGTNGAQ
ncbi:DUF3613 domain-containing protein [Dyella jiangningensis]|jgi:hypothetical protein|uniref:DUF3613 domain-containing protein n=1 Tax=Dyella jiangningensis TaxID=1379159 RepID=UPI00241031AB|nr:DUF3613 domain-containing protein [Dyella jiangningensis]MDG2538445.1 DUF3613 domain-containing protein [Dyella jiangningensis]